MKHLNIEIKARSTEHRKIRDLLKEHKADFKGIDHQIDTYFNVPNGRLKLREGNIENNLIHYVRANQKEAKQADIILYKPQLNSNLKALLTAAFGVWKIVDKRREIYFIENVKFHIDTVKELGTFIEIEAIDDNESIGIEKLKQQCGYYRKLFNIKEEDLCAVSYSDMMV